MTKVDIINAIKRYEKEKNVILKYSNSKLYTYFTKEELIKIYEDLQNEEKTVFLDRKKIEEYLELKLKKCRDINIISLIHEIKKGSFNI